MQNYKILYQIILSFSFPVLIISCGSRLNNEKYNAYRKEMIGKEFPIKLLKGDSKIDDLTRPTMAVIWSKNCGISHHLLSLSEKIFESVDGKIKIIAITKNANFRPPNKIMKGAIKVDFFSLRRKELKEWNFLKNGYPVYIFIDNNALVRDYRIGLPDLSDSLIVKSITNIIEPLNRNK